MGWGGGHTFLSGVSAAAAEKDLAAWPSTPVTWRYLPNIIVVGFVGFVARSGSKFDLCGQLSLLLLSLMKKK